MRHTLTLEPDVDAALAEACRVSGKPLKEVVNATLRTGFAMQERLRSAPPLVITPSPGGPVPGISLVSISALEELIEAQESR